MRVGIPCDYRGGSPPFHGVSEQYICAVRDAVGAIPFLIPVSEDESSPGSILDAIDGLLLAGSPSRRGGDDHSSGSQSGGDLRASLLGAAIAFKKPVLCICRGFQELNVVLGGTLPKSPAAAQIDLCEANDTPASLLCRPGHHVRVSEGGILAKLLPDREIFVNSRRAEGINKLAPNLFIEAIGLDGAIEAVSLQPSQGFLLGVQWHPERDWPDNFISQALFAAFGRALAGDRCAGAS